MQVCKCPSATQIYSLATPEHVLKLEWSPTSGGPQPAGQVKDGCQLDRRAEAQRCAVTCLQVTKSRAAETMTLLLCSLGNASHLRLRTPPNGSCCLAGHSHCHCATVQLRLYGPLEPTSPVRGIVSGGTSGARPNPGVVELPKQIPADLE